MSVKIVVDSNTNWVTGTGILVGDTGFGVLGSSVPSTGDSGPGYAYDDIAHPGDDNNEICGRITVWPSHGTLIAYEDTGFVYTPTSDGNDSFTYQLYRSGVASGSPVVVPLQVGANNNTASGAALVGISTFVGGAAAGTRAATAPGAVLIGTSTIVSGTASGNVTAIASGAVLVGTGTISGGMASGTSSATSATATGATLRGTSTISGGAAHGSTTVSGFTPSAARTVQVLATTPNFSAGKFWDMSNPQKPVGRKDPNSTIDITFDWGDWLADMGTVSIASVVFTLNGVDQAGNFASSTQATIFVANGNTSGTSSVACKITTDSTPARIDERTVYLLMGDE